MALPDYVVTTDDELEQRVRAKTSYDSTTNELPGSASSADSQMAEIIADAKSYLYMKTRSDKWYSDVGYSNALVALTSMKAKEAVENVNISSYGIADETLSFTDTDPETSQQIQSWADQMNEGIQNSTVDFTDNDPGLMNTTSYVG
jgi:hypothetical protein